MRHVVESRVIDGFLVGALIAAWITHEAGAVVHSLVSIGFAIAVGFHVVHHWAAYRSAFRHRALRVVPDVAVGLSMAVITISGFTLWLANRSLGHGPAAIIGTLALLPHFWVHRSSLRGLFGRRKITTTR